MTHLLDRQTVELPQGRIAYADQGAGPAALFVHGVFLNADLWRNVIPGVSDIRRCIAVDLPVHGATVVGPDADVSLDGLTTVLEDLCDALDLDQVDVVANDTGGAVAQVFAADTNSKDLMAVEPQLRQLKAPTLVAWGTGDTFFEPVWAERLREMIPGVQKVVEIPGAKLFYPDERAADLIPHLRSHFVD